MKNAEPFSSKLFAGIIYGTLLMIYMFFCYNMARNVMADTLIAGLLLFFFPLWTLMAFVYLFKKKSRQDL